MNANREVCRRGMRRASTQETWGVSFGRSSGTGPRPACSAGSLAWLVRSASRRQRTARPLAAPEPLERRAVLSVAPYAGFDDPILPTALPNDPSFAQEWSLQNTGQSGGTAGIDVNATQAWDISTGSRSVVVAVIDSGIDLTHPDLAANLWTNPGEIAGNGIDDDRNGFVDDVHGWNFVDNNANVQDGYGHGTHVAGIIGAVGNDGVGVTGVAWRVSLMVLRVQNDLGAGTTSAVIGALRYATTMRRDFGINVVVTNNSWEAAAGYSSVIEGLIREQGEAGITFVAAAGNHGTSNDVTPRYPSNYDLPNVIAVASLSSSGVLAGSSDYGATTVDLAAPGTFILSTWKGGWICRPIRYVDGRPARFRHRGPARRREARDLRCGSAGGDPRHHGAAAIAGRQDRDRGAARRVRGAGVARRRPRGRAASYESFAFGPTGGRLHGRIVAVH